MATAKLPTTQPALADFFGELVGVPNTTTLLNGAHDSSVTTITVDAVPTGAPTAGAVYVDNECITYTGKTATTITGCTRGAQDTTAASHSDDATVRWGLTKGTVNQLIQELIQMSKTGAGAKGADVASAAALNIGEDGHYFHVTGTTTITSIETRLSGQIVVLEFDGALTLTHNATSLILRGGVNVTTVAGDIFAFASEGSGNWREVWRLTNENVGIGALAVDRWQFGWNAGESVTSAVGGTGAFTNPEAAYTGMVAMATGGTSGGTSAMVRSTANNLTGMTGTWKLRFWSFMWHIDSLADVTAKVYMTNEAVGTTDPSNTARHIGIKVSGGNAFFSTADGTTEQTTDIDATLTANSTHIVTVTFDGTTAKCYVNGTLVATHSTNVPTTEADQEPRLRAYITNSAAAAKNLRHGNHTAVFQAR